jgi:hypothetical protein
MESSPAKNTPLPAASPGTYVPFEDNGLEFLDVVGESAGQGGVQIGELGMAFLLSALIALEREIRHKSAGLRRP